ncbi:MAG: ester cyclase [Actinomycetota bacterium]
MSEENKQLYRRFAEAVYNDKQVDAVSEFLSDSYVDHNSWPGYEPNREGFELAARDFLAAFPDAHVEIQDMVAEGDKVVIYHRLVGTNEGEFLRVPGSGRRVEIPGVDIVRIESGKLAERWGLLDHLSLIGQIGVSPPFGG